MTGEDLKKFTAIIESQQTLIVLEREIDMKMAL